MDTSLKERICKWCHKPFIRDPKVFGSTKYCCLDCQKESRRNAKYINQRLGYKRIRAKKLMATSTYYEVLIKSSVNSTFLKERLEQQLNERFFWEE